MRSRPNERKWILCQPLIYSIGVFLFGSIVHRVGLPSYARGMLSPSPDGVGIGVGAFRRTALAEPGRSNEGAKGFRTLGNLARILGALCFLRMEFNDLLAFLTKRRTVHPHPLKLTKWKPPETSTSSKKSSVCPVWTAGGHKRSRLGAFMQKAIVSSSHMEARVLLGPMQWMSWAATSMDRAPSCDCWFNLVCRTTIVLLGILHYATSSTFL